MKRFIVSSVLLAGLVQVGACSKEAAPVESAAEPAAAAPTNRIDVPAPVRENLGMTFARVEPRAVARTIRVPGRFELLPSARREHHAPLSGRVELAVGQFDRVEQGSLLYRLDSPQWRELQRDLADSEGIVVRLRATATTVGPLLEAHRDHAASLQSTTELWTRRLNQLEEVRQAGGGRADEFTQAEASLRQARADLAEAAEKGAELEARGVEVAAELSAATMRVRLLLDTAASLTGQTAEALSSVEGTADERPLWQRIDVIDLRSPGDGVVETLAVTGGAWVEPGAMVMSTVEPERVRFRARGLQSDLGRLRDGLPARIVPPLGTSIGAESMNGTLALGLTADPDERTIDLLVVPETVLGWARAGVSAFVELTTEGGGEQLAIPLGAVVRDGITPIIFRRDPKDPDRVIRLEADLGIDDGRWVVVASGVKEGDDVVVNGAHQLMLASSGTAAKGGHFHSDGTFHAGEDH